MKVQLKAEVVVTDDQQCCAEGKGKCPYLLQGKHLPTGHRCGLFECTLHPTVKGVPVRCATCLQMQG